VASCLARGINSLCASRYLAGRGAERWSDRLVKGNELSVWEYIDFAGRGVERPSDRPGKGMNSLCASRSLAGRGEEAVR
jgi:hypothetical protein